MLRHSEATQSDTEGRGVPRKIVRDLVGRPSVLDLTALTPNETDRPSPESPTDRAYRLIKVQHYHSPVKGLSYCQRVSVPNRNPVYDDKGFHNIISCNNAMCLVCGLRKENRNSDILTNVISNTISDYTYFIGTLTLSTDCSIKEQAVSLQKAYSKWIDNVRNQMKNKSSSFECSWSNDITFDPIKLKAHLHRHFIARVPRETNIDNLDYVVRNAWHRAVRTNTNRSSVDKAFYFAPVSENAASVAYLYKTVREVANSGTKKNAYGERLSWLGLIEAIHSGKEHLIGLYRSTISGMKGRRWFGLSLGMKSDYREPTEEVALLEARTQEEERFITAIEGTPQIHNAIVTSGALATLRKVLSTNRDGDRDIEAFRNLVDKWRPILSRTNREAKFFDLAVIDFRIWAQSTKFGLI